MKLKDIFGLTSYLAYGGGNAHYKTDAVDKFKFQRFFVGNYVITKGNLDLRVEPTWQNFKYDTYLKQLKDLGVTTVFSPQGSFDWYNTQGKIGKVNPIKPGDDPLKESSWADFKELCRQLAIRYADDTAQYLSEAKVFTGTPAYLANVPKAGLGLVDFVTGTNEYTFLHGWSGAAYTLTPEMGAVQMKCIIDGVRSVSKTLKIVCPSDHTPNLNNQRRLLTHLKSLYAAEGKPMPTDFYLDFHWYMRNTSQDQSGGTAGETPETIHAYTHALAMDALCMEFGLLGWLCTETGWATDNSKQSAPILEGFTREQSQGILMIRLALIWGASKYCKGISFWHCRDDYDLPPYAKGGINKKDWSAKPARTICEEFLAKYGEYEISDFFQINGIYSVAAKIAGEVRQEIFWSDKKNIGRATPMPFFDKFNPTPTPMLTIQNNKLYKDGQPFFIKELNSPETLLRLSFNDFKAVVDYAASVGLNTIYCTLYAGDKYKGTLHPYNASKVVGGTSFGNPASGFNETTLADWKAKFEYASSKGFVIHGILSEKENHFIHTDAEQHTFIDMMVQTFGHLPIIWDREEFPLGKDAFINNHFNYLRTKDPNNIIAIHNNTGEKPWTGHADVIEFLSIQADISSFDSIIKSETTRGFAAYSSEMTGGFQPNDTAKAEKIRTAGGEFTSGAGIYIPSLDQDATLAQLKTYEPVYKALSGTITPPPNPTGMLKYSLSPNPFLNSLPLNGAAIPTGSKVYVYFDGTGKIPLLFSPSGQKESGAPYEYKGGQPVTFADGANTVSVKGADNAVLGTANFTVGTVAPPPTDIKGTTFVKKNGKIEFSFEDNTKLTVTPD